MRKVYSLMAIFAITALMVSCTKKGGIDHPSPNPDPVPAIEFIRADTAFYGGAATITYSVKNADRLWINGILRPLSGAFAISNLQGDSLLQFVMKKGEKESLPAYFTVKCFSKEFSWIVGGPTYPLGVKWNHVFVRRMNEDGSNIDTLQPFSFQVSFGPDNNYRLWNSGNQSAPAPWGLEINDSVKIIWQEEPWVISEITPTAMTWKQRSQNLNGGQYSIWEYRWVRSN